MKQNIYTLILLLFCFGSKAQTVITDNDLGSETYTWTSDTEYLLDGYVFLEAGGVLNIEAGTVIKAKGTPTGGDNASALIISKGAQIFAEGTAVEPIIFTAELDDFESLTADNKGLWGGLVILGNAVVGVNGGVQNIEGIPSTEGRAEYGGDDNEDDSGSLKYVSIRHGGARLEANNEINGLTLGGVGSGTDIDYIEVFANLDDGIEWFGGTVNVKHAVVSFCGDDSYDFDQSWNGKGQFWFSLQNELSNRAGEWDGSEAADLNPKASPMISNVSFIGAGAGSENEDGNNAIQIRDDGAVQLYNSVITGFADGAIQLDNDADGSTLLSDSYDRYLAGELTFTSLVMFDFGDGDNFEAIVSTDGGDDAAFATYLGENSSVYADPGIAGISRTNDGGLDPRIKGDGAAFGGAVAIDDDFFTPTSYRGAFGSTTNWADGWTALSDNGYFGNLVSDVDDIDGFVENKTLKLFPNPANGGVLNIELDLEETKRISLTITDMNGRLVKSISNSQNYISGKYRLAVDIDGLPRGYYTVNVVADKGIFSNKLIVSK